MNAYNDHYLKTEWDVDRIFQYDSLLRAEAVLDDGRVVEAMWHTDETKPVTNATEHGLIVDTQDLNAEAPAADGPGETLWTAE